MCQAQIRYTAMTTEKILRPTNIHQTVYTLQTLTFVGMN
jgi:hypothetical protein